VTLVALFVSPSLSEKQEPITQNAGLSLLQNPSQRVKALAKAMIVDSDPDPVGQTELVSEKEAGTGES